MKISKIEGADQGTIIDAIYSNLCDSRFTAEVTRDGFKNIKISQVRLREKKPYCGNHAKACERPHVGKHKRADYLEGADWVEFNDRLNDVLDKLGVSAKVESGVCNLRKGDLRRTYYDANTFAGQAWQWDKYGLDHQYTNGIDRTVKPSGFPMGTPGIYEATGYNVEG